LKTDILFDISGNLTTVMCCLSWNLEPSGPLHACNGIALPLLYT